MNKDSYAEMLAAVQRFHAQHNLHEHGDADMSFRVALLAEELGELSAAVTKGKGIEQVSEECADLLILLLGTALAADFDLNMAFWDKLAVIKRRQGRLVDGRLRVSEFKP